MKDTNIRLTEEDLDLYDKVYDASEILNELEGWDEGITLTLYKNKDYKYYKREYLKVIFEAIEENIKYHQTRMQRYTTTQVIEFMGIDGEVYRGSLSEVTQDSQETQQIFNCMDLGKDHLIEFLTFYMESLVKYEIKEETKNTDLYYLDYMWGSIQDVIYFTWTNYVANFLDARLEGETKLTLKLLKDALGNVVDTSNTEEVGKGKDLYNRIEAYVNQNWGYVRKENRKQKPRELIWDEDIEE